MLGILLTVLHVVVSVFLILVVLLQTGKRADLAGAFGGGGSQTAFGTRGAATLLTKLTTAAAVMFMVTSLSLSLIATRAMGTSGGSVLPADDPAQTQPAPTAPATVPEAPPAAADDAVDEPAEAQPGEAQTDEAQPAEQDPAID